MELIDLKTFAAVVEQRTATKAAVFLGLTQPGVSKHLARLEEEVGGQLFKRQGKYLVVNEFGVFFYEKVKKILIALGELSRVSYGSTCPVGSLKLGLTDAATRIITPSSLAEFRTQYPGIHISLDVESSERIEEGVLDETYDLGVVTAGFMLHAGLEEEKLYDDYIDVVVGIHHALARRRCIPLKELERYPLIISPKRRRTRLLIDNVFRAHHVNIRDTIDVYIPSAAVRLAEAGVGVALLPRMFIAQEMPPHRCAHVKIAGDPLRRTLSLIRKRGVERSDAVTCYHDIIMRWAKRG